MKNINKDIKLALKIEEDKIRRTISACSSWPGLPRTKSRATRNRDCKIKVTAAWECKISLI